MGVFCMCPHDPFVIPGDGCKATEPGPPCSVIHDLVHHPTDSLSLIRFINQPPDETLSVPEATQEEIPDQRAVTKSAKHQKSRVIQHLSQTDRIETMGRKKSEALCILTPQQFV